VKPGFINDFVCSVRGSLQALPQLSQGDQVKEGEMGGTRSMHGTDEKCVEKFGRKD